MRKLLIATGNKGKLPEIKAKLEGLPFEIINLGDLGFPPDFEAEEPATTFEGNAIVKAMTLGRKTGLLTLADDSGLEVEALDGRPGVYSARYVPGTDSDRCKKILDELANVADERRGARFRCVIAIYDPETEKVRTCDGMSPGLIIHEERGTNGFGYDSIFLSDKLRKTFAEMTAEEKNIVSHRGKALEKAREILQKEFVAP